MENKGNYEKHNKETTTYHVTWLDNGVVVTSPEYDLYECEKFTDAGRANDKSMIEYFGKLFWEDFISASDILLNNKLKVTITIEKDE